jgi:putative transcriptional regulator
MKYSKVNISKLESISKGKILVAKPFWQNELYKRSVVLIFRHENQKVRGIILNKVSSISLNDVVPDFGYNAPLFFGGLNAVDGISCIHCSDDVPGSIELGNGLFFGGDYEYITEMSQSGMLSLEDFRFYVGQIEWNEETLLEEINQGKWWTSKISLPEFYSNSFDHLWSDKLIRENHMYGLFEEWPDPSLS